MKSKISNTTKKHLINILVFITFYFTTNIILAKNISTDFASKVAINAFSKNAQVTKNSIQIKEVIYLLYLQEMISTMFLISVRRAI